MVVRISDIEKTVALLLGKLKEAKGDEIAIESDYYWDVANGELYNPYSEPKSLSLGQLSQEIDEIQNALKKGHLIAYDLKKVSSIIKVLGLEYQTAF